jgi:parvulin-like peptidyl-prolyl isomerase
MKIRYLVPFALLVLLALAVAACGAPPLSTPTPGGYEAPTAPAPTATVGTAITTTTEATTTVGGVDVALAQVKPADGVLATVNGEEITWAEFQPELFRALHVVTQQYAVDWNQASNVALIPQLEDQIVQNIADRTLLRQLAAQDGYVVSDSDLQTRIISDTADIMASGYFSSFVQYEQDYGLTDEYFARLVEDELIIEHFTNKQEVAAQEEQVHARHILVATEEEANAVLERLAGGEDWAALAAELSTDTGSKDNGGDLGWFGRGVMVEAFETAAFALETNQISDPVKSDYGYHIIQVLEKGMKDLDAAARQQKQQEAFQTWFDQQKAASEVSIVMTFAQQ